jgi:hypothetical protein
MDKYFGSKTLSGGKHGNLQVSFTFKCDKYLEFEFKHDPFFMCSRTPMENKAGVTQKKGQKPSQEVRQARPEHQSTDKQERKHCNLSGWVEGRLVLFSLFFSIYRITQ